MSVDAQRFMDLTPYFHTLWSAPLQIILSLIFLYLTMGPSIFAGFAVMILMIPLNGGVAGVSRKMQVKQMGFKDSRIKLVNEVLNGIKVHYALSLSFLILSYLTFTQYSLLCKNCTLSNVLYS